MRPTELTAGLWRWTAPHPDWRETDDDGSPSGWGRDVACALWVDATHAVFVDPLLPEDDAELWTWADEQSAGRDVVALETIPFHRRSRAQVVARFGATAAPPASVAALSIPIADETLYWLAGPRALICGDSLLGGTGGGLELCPEAWLAYLHSTPSRAAVRDALREALLGLDVELVLVAHGEPVRSGARAALARALA